MKKFLIFIALILRIALSVCSCDTDPSTGGESGDMTGGGEPEASTELGECVHVFSEAQTVTPATCQSKGRVRCSCMLEETKNIPASVDAHTFKILEERKSSCTEKGYRIEKC